MLLYIYIQIPLEMLAVTTTYPISASSTILLHVLSLQPVPWWKITRENVKYFPRGVASFILLQPTSVEDLTGDVTSQIIYACSCLHPINNWTAIRSSDFSLVG
jgi:hypothetical protein